MAASTATASNRNVSLIKARAILSGMAGPLPVAPPGTTLPPKTAAFVQKGTSGASTSRTSAFVKRGSRIFNQLKAKATGNGIGNGNAESNDIKVAGLTRKQRRALLMEAKKAQVDADPEDSVNEDLLGDQQPRRLQQGEHEHVQTEKQQGEETTSASDSQTLDDAKDEKAESSEVAAENLCDGIGLGLGLGLGGEGADAGAHAQEEKDDTILLIGLFISLAGLMFFAMCALNQWVNGRWYGNLTEEEKRRRGITTRLLNEQLALAAQGSPAPNPNPSASVPWGPAPSASLNPAQPITNSSLNTAMSSVTAAIR